MAQGKVRDLIKDRILVGHALFGDLGVLKISHPKDKIRDTCLYEPFRTMYCSGRTPALKKVVQGELGIDIQMSEHDSVIGLRSMLIVD
jgi:RNA exonuclease 4